MPTPEELKAQIEKIKADAAFSAEAEKKRKQNEQHAQEEAHSLEAILRQRRAKLATVTQENTAKANKKQAEINIPNVPNHKDNNPTLNEAIAPKVAFSTDLLQKIREGVKLNPTKTNERKAENPNELLKFNTNLVDRAKAARPQPEEEDNHDFDDLDVNDDYKFKPAPAVAVQAKPQAMPTIEIPVAQVKPEIKNEDVAIKVQPVRVSPVTVKVNPIVTPAEKAAIVTKAPIAQPKINETVAAPQAEKGNRVAELGKIFEGKTHPYSKVGGNLAGGAHVARPVVTSPVTPAPEKIATPIVKPTPTAKPAVKSQEQLDREYAEELQRQFDREEAARRKQIEDDHLLAAKLQVAEEVKDAAFPANEELHRPTLNNLAADIYSRGLSDLKNNQQNTPAKAHPSKGPASQAKYLSGFAMSIYVETHSLQLAITANGFVLQEVHQAMMINIQADQKSKSLNIDIQSAGYAQSIAYSRNGLFGVYANYQASYVANSMTSNHQEKPEPVTHNRSTPRR